MLTAEVVAQGARRRIARRPARSDELTRSGGTALALVRTRVRAEPRAESGACACAECAHFVSSSSSRVSVSKACCLRRASEAIKAPARADGGRATARRRRANECGLGGANSVSTQGTQAPGTPTKRTIGKPAPSHG